MLSIYLFLSIICSLALYSAPPPFPPLNVFVIIVENNNCSMSYFVPNFSRFRWSTISRMSFFFMLLLLTSQKFSCLCCLFLFFFIRGKQCVCMYAVWVSEWVCLCICVYVSYGALWCTLSFIHVGQLQKTIFSRIRLPYPPERKELTPPDTESRDPSTPNPTPSCRKMLRSVTEINKRPPERRTNRDSETTKPGQRLWEEVKEKQNTSSTRFFTLHPNSFCFVLLLFPSCVWAIQT